MNRERRRRIVGVARGEGLDGHLAAQGIVHGEQDAAHPAGSDLREDAVAREAFRKGRGRVEQAVDLRERAEFGGKLRQGGPAAVEVIGKRVGQSLLGVLAHRAASESSRKRFTAR